MAAMMMAGVVIRMELQQPELFRGSLLSSMEVQLREGLQKTIEYFKERQSASVRAFRWGRFRIITRWDPKPFEVLDPEGF